MCTRIEPGWCWSQGVRGQFPFDLARSQPILAPGGHLVASLGTETATGQRQQAVWAHYVRIRYAVDVAVWLFRMIRPLGPRNFGFALLWPFPALAGPGYVPKFLDPCQNQIIAN